MKRVVPKSHKVRIEFVSGIGIPELIIGLVFFFVIIAIVMSQVPFGMHISLFLGCLALVLLYDIDGEKGYKLFYNIIKYIIEQKVYYRSDNIEVNTNQKIDNEENKENEDSINDKDDINEKKIKRKKKNHDRREKKFTDFFMPIKSIDDELIHFKNGKKAAIIKIAPMQFVFLSQGDRSYYIEKVLARVLRTLTLQQSAQIVKVNLPKNYDKYIRAEEKKEKEIINAYQNGIINEKELGVRDLIINEKIKFYDEKNRKSLIYEENYYLVIYGNDSKNLLETKEKIVQIFLSSKMKAKKLNRFKTAIFLKANFHPFFNPKDAYKQHSEKELIDWIIPKKIEIDSRNFIVDGVYGYGFRVGEFPVVVDDCWAAGLSSIPDSKLTLNITPIERNKAISHIDNSIEELKERAFKSTRASKYIDNQQHISALVGVEKVLASSKESFFSVNMFLTVYDYKKSKYERLPEDVKQMRGAYSSTLRRDTVYRIREDNFNVTNDYAMQKNIMQSANVSSIDYFAKEATGMYGALVGASFPFVSQRVADVGGSNIGYIDGSPAIFDFFKRDNRHVNSNMMIIGKSGSGKSYFTKVLLSNLAADNSKIFILDPENEYGNIVKSYSGKRINLASSKDGRINPFHVTQTISDMDSLDDENDVKYSISQHLQFLESFFALLFKGLSSYEFEILNNLVKKLYSSARFTKCINLNDIKPEDFPIFDNLYDLILDEMKKSKNEKYKSSLELLISYVEKFARDGRNADLWNGPSNIETSENMIVFNYQQLLASNNNLITNAQMLLVIHWLNNEIIRNKNYNMINKLNRKIVVIIDEAHVFIDDKNPVALDFMYNLAKRIRKYGGMQIIITQNVKDFVGSEELNRKSAAIVNASQYSFVFSLSPDDMNDLCILYDKAGGMSQFEQSIIINNDRGQAFYIAAPFERGVVNIVASKEIENVFKE